MEDKSNQGRAIYFDNGEFYGVFKEIDILGALKFNGVEQDLNTYLSSLKNPGSGWEHHFKASSSAGMGAKPSPIANAGGGQPNPWKTGNVTQQMLISEQNPQLAAVLKQEAQTK